MRKKMTVSLILVVALGVMLNAWATVVVNIGPATGGIGTSNVNTNVKGSSTYGGSPSFQFPVLYNAHSQLISETMYLPPGDNSVTIPGGTGWWAVIPPTTTTATITLKGASGDTGILTGGGAPIGPIPLPSASPPTSMILNTSAGIYNVQVLFY